MVTGITAHTQAVPASEPMKAITVLGPGRPGLEALRKQDTSRAFGGTTSPRSPLFANAPGALTRKMHTAESGDWSSAALSCSELLQPGSSDSCEEDAKVRDGAPPTPAFWTVAAPQL